MEKSVRTDTFSEEDGFPPLQCITRPTLDTASAAFYLNRRPQTLRVWALTGHPIAPVRVHGRLAWRVDDIKRLLRIGGEANE
jgi:hypothetical protein